MRSNHQTVVIGNAGRFGPRQLLILITLELDICLETLTVSLDYVPDLSCLYHGFLSQARKDCSKKDFFSALKIDMTR